MLIHWYWTGPPMPDWQWAIVRMWQDMHPDFEVRGWTDDTIPTLRNQDLFDDPARFSPKSHPGQFKADLLRYELLLDMGGVWVDTDLEPRRHIGPLVEQGAFAAWEEQGKWVNNALLGFPAGHPAMQHIVDGLRDSVLSQRHLRVNHQVGARYITPILRDRDDVTILPQEQVYPYRYDELHRAHDDFPDVWMVHRWANSLKGREP
jgi:mannosyltransferase OCH1-like enzyme